MKLTLSHVTKEFDKKYAVEDFSAEFERGVYGLLGPNGAGKTTLMRMMVDILTPPLAASSSTAWTFPSLGQLTATNSATCRRKSASTGISPRGGS